MSLVFLILLFVFEAVVLWQFQLRHGLPELFNDLSPAPGPEEPGRDSGSVDSPGEQKEDQVAQKDERELADEFQLELSVNRVVGGEKGKELFSSFFVENQCVRRMQRSI